MASRSRNRALVLEIVADPRKAQKGLKGINKAIGKFAGGIAATAATYFGTRALIDFGKASITAASDLEESTNAVERAMGGASEEIKKLGRTSATELGLSKTALNDLAVAFSAFGTQIAPGNEGSLFEEIVQRATDFASVMNIDVQDAMSTFQSALAGQSRPIREYGIDLSAAAVEAHALKVGIWDGVGAISEAEKVQGRYSLILQETDQYAGDFKDTSDGLANSTRILSAEWADFQAELGKEALPLAAEGVQFLTQQLEDMKFTIRDTSVAWETVNAWTVRNLPGASDAQKKDAPNQEAMSRAMKTYGNELDTGVSKAKALQHALFELGQEGEWSASKIREFATATSSSKDDLLQASAALEHMYPFLDKAALGFDDMKTTIHDMHGPIVTAADEMRNLKDETAMWVDTASRTGELRSDMVGIVDVWADLSAEEQAALDIFALLKYAANEHLRELRAKWDSAKGRVEAYNQSVRDAIELMGILGRLGSGTSTGGSSHNVGGTLGPQSADLPTVQVNFNGLTTGDPAEIGREVAGALTAYRAVGGGF